MKGHLGFHNNETVQVMKNATQHVDENENEDILTQEANTTGLNLGNYTDEDEVIEVEVETEGVDDPEVLIMNTNSTNTTDIDDEDNELVGDDFVPKTNDTADANMDDHNATALDDDNVVDEADDDATDGDDDNDGATNGDDATNDDALDKDDAVDEDEVIEDDFVDAEDDDDGNKDDHVDVDDIVGDDIVVEDDDAVPTVAPTIYNKPSGIIGHDDDVVLVPTSKQIWNDPTPSFTLPPTMSHPSSHSSSERHSYLLYGTMGAAFLFLLFVCKCCGRKNKDTDERGQYRQVARQYGNYDNTFSDDFSDDDGDIELSLSEMNG